MANPLDLFSDSSSPTLPSNYSGGEDPTALKDFKDLAGNYDATITSLFRTPEHNREVGGVSDSQHTKGTAGDFIVPERNKSAFKDAASSLGYQIIDEGNHIHLQLPKGRGASVVSKNPLDLFSTPEEQDSDSASAARQTAQQEQMNKDSQARNNAPVLPTPATSDDGLTPAGKQAVQFFADHPMLRRAAGLDALASLVPDAPDPTKTTVGAPESAGRSFVQRSNEVGASLDRLISGFGSLFDEAGTTPYDSNKDPVASSLQQTANEYAIQPSERQGVSGRVGSGLGGAGVDVPVMMATGGEAKAAELTAEGVPLLRTGLDKLITNSTHAARAAIIPSVVSGEQTSHAVKQAGGSDAEAAGAGVVDAFTSLVQNTLLFGMDKKIPIRAAFGAGLAVAGNKVSNALVNPLLPDSLKREDDSTTSGVVGGLMAALLGRNTAPHETATTARVATDEASQAIKQGDVEKAYTQHKAQQAAEQEKVRQDAAKQTQQALNNQAKEDAQRKADQEEADHRNQQLEQEYAGKTRLEIYPDGSMERVPISPPEGVTADDIKAEREQKAQEQADAAKRVELERAAERIRVRDQLSPEQKANRPTYSKTMGISRAQHAANNLEARTIDAVRAENPNASPEELVPLVKDKLAQSATPVEPKVPAADNMLKVQPIPTKVAPDTSSVADIIGLEMKQDGTADKSSEPEKFFPKLHQTIAALVNHGGAVAENVQNLIRQRKIVFAPNSEAIGRTSQGAAEFDPNTGKMYIYTDGTNPHDAVASIIKAVHESGHFGTYNAREGRSPIMQMIMGKGYNEAKAKVETVAKDSTYTLESDTPPKTIADRAKAAVLKAQKSGNYDEELMTYFAGEVARSRSGYGRLGGLVSDMKAGARNALRSVGLDIKPSLNDIASATQKNAEEAVKTEAKPLGEQSLNMVGSSKGKGFDEAKANGETFKLKDSHHELYEIPDNKSHLLPEGLKRLKLGEEVPVGELLSHDKLYHNYEDIASNVTVKADPTLPFHITGAYKRGQGNKAELVVHPLFLRDPTTLRKILLHELQHHVQTIEGMPAGGNAAMFTNPSFGRTVSKYKNILTNIASHVDTDRLSNMLVPEAKQRFKDETRTKWNDSEAKTDAFFNGDFLDHIKPDLPEEDHKYIQDTIQSLIKAHKDLDLVEEQHSEHLKSADEAYHRLSGETVARNVEYRSDQSPAWLKEHPFETTMGKADAHINPDETIVKGDYLFSAPKKLPLSAEERAARPEAQDVREKTPSLDMAKEEEQTPEFKKWFGNSKVVDSSGQPKIMYHGTSSKSDFDAFRSRPDKDIGMHFGTRAQANHDRFVDKGPISSDSNKHVDEYGWRDIRPSRVIPVFLSIKNPLRMEDAFGSASHALLKALKDTGIASPSELASLEAHLPVSGSRGQVLRYGDQSGFHRELQNIIEKHGYDGIVYTNKNEHESIGTATKEPTFSDSYIAFHPNQIKSAIGNNGKYSSSDSIMEMAKEAEPSEDDSPEQARSKIKALGTALGNIFKTNPTKEIGRQEMVGWWAKHDRDYTTAERQVHKYKVYFDKMPLAKRLQLIDDWQTGKPVSDPTAAEFFKQITPLYKNAIDYIRSVDPDLLKNMNERYLAQVWKTTPSLKQLWDDPSRLEDVFGHPKNDFLTKGPLSGSKSFLKARKFKTLKEGMEKGKLTPRTTNPAELTMIKLGEILKFAGMIKFREDMKARGMLQDHAVGKTPPEGWSRVNDPAFIGKILPDVIAHDLNNYLSRGLSDVPGFKKIRQLENLLVAGKLGWSGFHAGFTTADNMITGAEVALRRALIGDFKGSIIGMMKTAASPILSPYEGGALNKMFLGESPKTDAQARRWHMIANVDRHTYALLDLIEKGGGRAFMDPSEWNGGIAKAAQIIRQKDYGAMTNPMNTLKLGADASGYLIHRKLVPAQKAAARVLILKFELDRFAKKLGKEVGDYQGIIDAMNPDAAAQISRKVVNLIDDRLGHMSYDNQFWNPYTKHMGQLFIMAPGWVAGTLRTIVGGVGDARRLLPTTHLGDLQLTGPEKINGPLDKAGKINDAKFGRLTSRTSNLMTLALLTAAASGVFQYTMTGQWPQEPKDYVHPKTGRKNADGTDERMAWPTYAKEHYALLTHPTQELGSKLNQPLVQMAYELLKNADYTNTEIYDSHADAATKAKQAAEYIASSFITPIVKSNFDKASNTDAVNPDTPKANLAMKIGGFVGATPAKQELDHSDAQNFINQKYFDSFPKAVLSRADKDRFSSKAQAANSLREGQPVDLSNFTSTERKQIRQNAKGDADVATFTKRFKSIRTIEDKIAAWDLATPEERTKYSMRKNLLHNAREQVAKIGDPDKKAEVQQKLNEIRSGK